MKKLNQFIHAHPFLSCALTAVISGLLLVDLVGWCWFGEAPSPLPYVFWLAGVAATVWAHHRWPRKVVGLLVVAALLCVGTPTLPADEPEQELPALVIGVLVVIIIGGVIGCKIVKRCAKIARGRTNAPPEELRFVVAGQAPVQYGAAFSTGEYGYCAAQRMLAPPVPVTFTMDILVESVSNATTTIRADVGEQFVETFSELREEIAQDGLALATGVGQFESFSRNRQPVSPEQVPITMDWRTGTIRHGDGGVLVSIEQSTDLRHWTPLLRIEVEVGTHLQIPDASESGQMFYRTTLGRP